MRNSVSAALTLSFVCFSLSCKTRQFNSKRTEAAAAKSTTANRLVLSEFKPGENYGAGYDLGIPFSPVDEEVVSSFTKVLTESDDTVAKFLINAGSPTGNLAWASLSRSDSLGDNSFGMLNPPGEEKKEALSNLLQPVLDAYFSQTSKWLSLKCFDVSKDGGKSLVAFDYHKLEKKNGAITCSFLNKIGQIDLAKTFTEGLKFGFSPGRRIDSKEHHQTHWNFSEEGSKSYFTVGLYKPFRGFPVVSIQSTPDVTVGATTLPGPSFSLVIIGNYLVPLHTWSISKITPVPIMKIINNNGRLSAGPFYDYGLVVLKSLDSDARLVSVMSPNDGEKWKSGNHKSIGNFARHYPELYGTTLSPEEKANMVTSFKTNGQLSRVVDNKTLTLEHLWSKTERLEVGAIHLTIDAKYGALSHQTANSFVQFKKVDWNKIRQDYLGSAGVDASVHINTLDSLNHTGVSERGSVREKLDNLCGKNWGSVTAQTPGFIAETEIVLAGEWPERLVGAVKTSDLGSEFQQCP